MIVHVVCTIYNLRIQKILLSRYAPRHSLLLSQFIDTEAISQDQLDFVEVGYVIILAIYTD